MIFEIGFDSYEESHYIQLFHEKEFSEDEFNELAYKYSLEYFEHCRKDILEEYLEAFQDSKYFQALYSGMSQEEYIENKVTEIKFDSTMLVFIVDKLIQYEQFKKVEPEISFALFGWCDIIKGESFTSSRNKHHNEIQKRYLERRNKDVR